MKRFLLLPCAFFALLSASAQAHTEKFRVFEMSGALENLPNDSEGFGTALITFDLDLVTMRVQASFGGLTGMTTNSHIHCCDPYPANDIVATTLPTFPGFPMGVTAGAYDNTFDMTLASSYNPAFVTESGDMGAALERLLNAARAGNQAYLNIHSTFRSPGEIRGYLQPVPEPSAIVFALIGYLGFLASRRR